MTIISEDCFIANLEKAMQDNPIRYADNFWGELEKEQPEIATSFAAIVVAMAKMANMEHDDQVTPEVRQEGIEYVMLAVCGILYKSLNAQREADEMKEVWG
jgi:hypothetical protein